MLARWMAAGFVHGVLNTDNMNINGESFDYGPYRFLPRNDPNFTAAYFDQSGLYAFGRQPEAVFWNLQQLAGCLALLADGSEIAAALSDFGETYRRDPSPPPCSTGWACRARAKRPTPPWRVRRSER